MRIDPNRIVDTNALPPSPKAAARPAEAGEGAAAGDVSPGGASALSMDLIRQSLQTTSDDKIARAKALIASGELDTPEAIGRAAQALIKFGI